MLSIFITLGLASAAVSNVTMSGNSTETGDFTNTTLIPTNSTGAPTMSPECLAQINKNTGLKSCGMGIDDAINSGQFPAINGQNLTELTSQLDSLCTPTCAAAITTLGQDLTSPVCASFISAVTEGISGFSSSDISALLKYSGELACAKDGSNYCFPTIASEVGMMGMGFTPEAGGSLISNQTLICSKCFKQEFNVVTARNIDAFSPVLKSTLQAGLNRITEAQGVCSNSAIGYSTLPILIITIASLLF